MLFGKKPLAVPVRCCTKELSGDEELLFAGQSFENDLGENQNSKRNRRAQRSSVNKVLWTSRGMQSYSEERRKCIWSFSCRKAVSFTQCFVTFYSEQHGNRIPGTASFLHRSGFGMLAWHFNPWFSPFVSFIPIAILSHKLGNGAVIQRWRLVASLSLSLSFTCICKDLTTAGRNRFLAMRCDPLQELHKLPSHFSQKHWADRLFLCRQQVDYTDCLEKSDLLRRLQSHLFKETEENVSDSLYHGVCCIPRCVKSARDCSTMSLKRRDCKHLLLCLY